MNVRHGMWVLSALVLAPLVAAGPLLAQTAASGSSDSPLAASVGSATRVDVGPTVDGRLDDPVWMEAEALTGFVQFEPVVGAPASEDTEVRILFDDDAVYVGAWLYDVNPAGIIVGERRRNANLSQSDAFIVVFDTYQDRQNGFVFGTNPGGIEYDGQIRGGGGVNTNWDASWNVATSQDENGWYVEMRIPFSTLRYGLQDEQSWGMNIARYIGRKNEEAVWSPVPRQYNLWRLTEAGTLQGIEPPPQRVTTITPFILGAAQQNLPGQPGTEYPFEFGADAKIGITPSLALDLTVNTDFAQVEVDDQQVDLTRFNLFFPERRPFFLENADLFSVQSSRPGSSQTPVQMFHSRRIGVEGGQEIPIEAGARVSGRIGSTDVGALYMRTEGLDGVQDANGWVVARVLQELPNRSRVGAIFTERSSTNLSDDYNRTFGVDGRLGIGDEWTFDALLGFTDTPELDGDSKIMAFVGEYRSEQWQLSTYYDHVGQDFNPEVGFVRRIQRQLGYNAYHARAMRFIRVPQIDWLREVRPHMSYTTNRTLDDGFKLFERVHMHSHIELESGAGAMPALDWELEGLDRPFAIAGTDIVVPAGTYSGWTFWSSQNTNRADPISFSNRISVGSFLGGTRTSLSGGVNARRGGTFTGGVNITHNRIDLPQGDFNTTLTRLQARYAFTPALSIQSSVQYSDQTGVWTGFVRFGWQDTAGTGLYVVYNERQLMDVQGISGILPRDGLDTAERTFVIKYTRQFDVNGLYQSFRN